MATINAHTFCARGQPEKYRFLLGILSTSWFFFARLLSLLRLVFAHFATFRLSEIDTLDHIYCFYSFEDSLFHAFSMCIRLASIVSKQSPHSINGIQQEKKSLCSCIYDNDDVHTSFSPSLAHSSRINGGLVSYFKNIYQHKSNHTDLLLTISAHFL